MTRKQIREILKGGGNWLGTARGWVQSRCHNGSTVTWNTPEVLVPHLTMRDVEELALEVATTAIFKDGKRIV